MRSRFRIEVDAFIRFMSDATGIVLFSLALWSLAKNLEAGVNVFDEGIVLSNSNFILAGQLPYRDFYTNYAPGLFYLVALTWRIFGVSVISQRILGLLVSILIAVLCGRLVALSRGRRFSWLPAGVALIWMSTLETRPSAWCCALAAALLFAVIGLRAIETTRPATFALAGFTWGLISFLRQDLFLYFNLVLSLLIIADRRLRSVLNRDFRPRFGWFAVGAFISIAIPWGFTFATSGFSAVAHDLFLDQIRYVMPARVLPVPPLFAFRAALPVPFDLPVFLSQTFEGAIVMALCAPTLALAARIVSHRVGFKNANVLVIVGALSIAVLPQVLGRTDARHSVHAIAPAIIIGFSLAEWAIERLRRITLKPSLLILFATLWLYPTRTALPHVSLSELPRFPNGPSRTLRELAPQRKDVLDFIAKHSSPNEPIFVGTYQHRRVWINELSLYFMANRTAGTRYTQFDPGLTNRLDVQKRMVQDFELRQPRVVVLSPCCLKNEPNKSVEEGASFLDDYLHSHYDVALRIEQYVLLIRRDA